MASVGSPSRRSAIARSFRVSSDFGVESDRSAQARESFAGLAVEEQGVAERGEIGGVARLDLHEDPELRNRFAMMAAFEQLRGE